MKKLLRLWGLWLFLVSTGACAAAYDDFINAIKAGNASEVGVWLKRGIDANTVDPGGQPVLHLAAREGHLDVVKTLIAAHADIDRRNANRETALMLAALGGRRSVVEFLIEKDAQINHPGWTPLVYAATNGHSQIVKILLDNHAYIDSSPSNGLTALMMAARGGHIETVRLLLDEDADPSLMSDRGETALDWALHAKNTDIAALIRARIKPGR